MTTSELMIGDWVMCNGINLQVAAITYQVGFRDDDDEIYWCSDDEFDCLDPIPLTEEILAKNGFEKAYTKVHGLMVDENLWFGHIGADYVELRLEGNVAVWKDYDEKADGLYSDFLFPLPSSVHQLQHLLRLCGIEKEIEL